MVENLAVLLCLYRYTRGIKVSQRNPTLRMTGRVRDIALVLVNGKRQTIVLNEGSQTTKFGFWASQSVLFLFVNARSKKGIKKHCFIIVNSLLPTIPYSPLLVCFKWLNLNENQEEKTTFEFNKTVIKKLKRFRHIFMLFMHLWFFSYGFINFTSSNKALIHNWDNTQMSRDVQVHCIFK